MKKLIIIVMCLMLTLSIYLVSDSNTIVTFAETEPIVYSIFDENNNLLFERDEVEIGDNYLSKDFKYYEIISLDKENCRGVAKFIKNVDKPKVEKSILPSPIKVERRVICMYMTHNDESYVPTDKVDSVYGNGGIKDVALAFKSELEKRMVDVFFDDTLHIPHDTSAYSRSLNTAKKLQNNYNPDAIFDIHRDGASRAYYVTKVDGKERGKVRIVVGKANPNMNLNEEFAMYLMSVGNELYPWLFTDIYYARGHYNQALDSKAILFEMGSHLTEKELEIASMSELADVVTTALYDTTVDNSGDLTIGGAETETTSTINKTLDKKERGKFIAFVLSVSLIVGASISVYITLIFYNKYKLSRKSKNKN